MPLARLSLAATAVLDLELLPGDDRGVDVRRPEGSCGFPDIHLDMDSLTEFN